MKRISVDIGGTFTDCFCRLGRPLHRGQGLDHAPQPGPGVQRGARPGLRPARAWIATKSCPGRLGAVRDHAGHQRPDRAQGPARSGRSSPPGFEATIPLSRGRGYGEGLDELGKNDLPAGTSPDPLVPQQLIRSRARAGRLRGQVRDAAGRGRRPAAAPRARRRRGPGARRVPDQRGREPGARAAGPGDHPGGIPGAPARAPSRCCCRTRCRAARASTSAARRPSSTPSCTRPCTTACRARAEPARQRLHASRCW